MVRKFHEFLHESKRISGAFDPMHAEEYFASIKHEWDCIPTNAREWKRFTDQYQELCDAYEEGRLPAGVSADKEPLEGVLAQLSSTDYKRSLYEVMADSRHDIKLKRTLSIAGISMEHCWDMVKFLNELLEKHKARQKMSKAPETTSKGFLSDRDVRKAFKDYPPGHLNLTKLEPMPLAEVFHEDLEFYLPLTKEFESRLLRYETNIANFEIVTYPGFFQFCTGGGEITEPMANEKLQDYISNNEWWS